MQWMLARSLATVVLLLWLSLGGASAGQTEKELQPTANTPVDSTEGVSSVCSQILDNIGPFCQYVIPPTVESENGMCQPEFSMETCNRCQDMVQMCGYPDDRDPENICLSDMAPSCASTANLENVSLFTEDYCFVVRIVCSNGFGSGIDGSGSGSGSLSSGSGVEPTIIPTNGSPPEPTTTEPVTNTPINTTTNGPTATIPIIATTTNADTGGTLITTTTNMVPIVLVRLEDLTEQQRENIVTIQFTGLSVRFSVDTKLATMIIFEEQFLGSVIIAFRVEVATMVNEFLLNQDQERKKRQAPPIQVSPDDIIVIQPLRIVNDQLLVSFVVGGQEGQSAPVSGADVASLLQVEGPSLAMTLSSLSGQLVQFVDAFITTTTGTTREISTIIATSQLPTTRSPPSIEVGREQVQKLSSGAIAGIVISVLVVVILAVAVVAVAIVALVLGYRNSGGTKLSFKRKSYSPSERYVTVLRHDADSHFMSEWTQRNEFADLPTAEEGNSGTQESTEL